jgi:hypothetical protein
MFNHDPPLFGGYLDNEPSEATTTASSTFSICLEIVTKVDPPTKKWREQNKWQQEEAARNLAEAVREGWI